MSSPTLTRPPPADPAGRRLARLPGRAPRLSPSFLALVPLLIGFGLRARALHLGNLGFDGGLAVALAASPLADLFDLSARDVHPPLYYLALAGWWRLAGPGVAAALWPSLALGALALASAWRLGRRVGGRPAALAITGLLALSPLHVYDGMAARDFGALVPLTLLGTALFLEWLDAPTGRARGVALGLAYLAGLLTSYYFVLTVLAHAFLVLWRGRSVARWLRIAGPGLAGLAGWALASGLRIGGVLAGGARPTSTEAPPLADLLSGLLQAVVGGSALPDGIGSAGAWAVVAAWGAALTFLPLLRRRTTAPPAASSLADLWLLVLVGFELTLVGTGAVVAFWLRDVAPARYALVILPYAVVLAGLGISAAVRAGRALGPAYALFALAPLLLGLWSGRTPVELPKSFWDPGGLVATLDGVTRADDAVVFISLEQAGYYSALSRAPRPWRVIPVGPRYLEDDLAAEAARKLDPLLARPGRVFLVLYQGGIAPQHRVLRERLAAAAYPAGEISLADSSLLEYVVLTATPRELVVPPVRYPGATLERIEMTGEARPGAAMGLALYWRADGLLPTPYRVFVHLLDGRGEKVGQHDGAPADGTRPTTTWTAGETIVDRHGLDVPESARAPFAVLIGLYADDGRLPNLEGTDATRISLP